MYKLKSTSEGAERFIAKLILNSLYGIFGRKQELLRTVTVRNDEVDLYLASHDVKTIINIENDKSVLLLIDNIENSVLKDQGWELIDDTTKTKKVVKSNVAIASAITSYARIKMIPFRIHPDTIYSETDSAIMTSKLDD